MSNPNERHRFAPSTSDRARSPRWDSVRDGDPNEDRNMWQAQEEDGGWSREHGESRHEAPRTEGGANRFERGNERRYSDAAYERSVASHERDRIAEQQRQGALSRGRGETWQGAEYGRSDYGRSDYGYGRSDYGRSYQDRGPERNAGSMNDPARDYAHGFGPNHGFGYPRPTRDDQWPDYRRGSAGPGFGGGGYGAFDGRGRVGSSQSTPTGLDRDRLGGRGEQGYGRVVGGYAGRGPKGYKRTDERVREDVCERLSQDDEVDASEISVRVESGEVTLEGSVETRRQKHRAEELAAEVLGVNDVHNTVRVRKSILTELKDKVTGDEPPAGGHAGSGTKTTSGTAFSRVTDHDRH